LTSYSVYVGYPKIAQTDVNESTLNITSMVISDPTPDSFHLDQTQVIGSHSSFHPQIFAFTASVSLLGAAAPFASVLVPAVQSNDGAVVDVSQTLSLSDASAFGDYAKAVMLNEEIELNIYGTPVLQEGALPKTTVTYNKTVTMKGESLCLSAMQCGVELMN
jgi:N-acetyl-gamma-glutamylphosphate reductase